MLNLFASETRLQILCVIGKGRLTGVEILKHMELAQPSLSQHLTQMVKAGILNAENVWKYTYYTVNGDGIKEAVKSFKILDEVAK
jgi:DNA-binding transcriptional ArsR family regulator